MKTFYNIQLARALAASLVIYAHLEYPGATFGQFGVDIFFVISGFIMTLICSRSADHFLLRRLARIVPLYWAATLAVFAVSWFRPEMLNSTRPNFGHLLQSLLFIPYLKENGLIHPVLLVGWTLNYEMYFYVLIAIAAFFVPHRYATVAASGGMFVLLILLKIVLKFAHPLPAWAAVLATFYSAPYVLEFTLGVGCYYLARFKPAQKLGIGPSLAAIVLSLGLMIYNQLFGLFGSASILWTQGLPSMVFITALLLLENRNFIFTRVTLVGDASYAIYLTHEFVVEGFRKIATKALHISMYSIPVSCIVILLAIVVGIVLYLFVEKPVHDKLRVLIAK
jgi:peptidoglycan/LPS O-acetylase OafA/YrhL